MPLIFKISGAKRHVFLWPACVVILMAVLAGCASTTSGSGMSTASNAGSVSNMPAHSAASRSSNQQGSNGVSAQNQDAGPQYLLKTLKVSMSVKDTRQTASQIGQWISTKDPRAVSAGTEYSKVDDLKNQYSVSMTFAVEATLYPQIYAYLRDYNLHNGHLNDFNETVQDVSNDYVDTQSRLKTYKGEQDRLLQMLKQAQSINDVLAVEQKLSDVEQNIEQTEAHLNDLNNQVTYYNVTIQLQPIDSVQPVSQPAPQWSPGQTFQQSFAAVIAIGQVLLTIFIWLLSFSVYIIPIGLIIWLVARWRQRRLPVFLSHVVQQTPPKSE